jgi:PAS domain S-box-containing protein
MNNRNDLTEPGGRGREESPGEYHERKRLEERLQNSEVLYHSLVENLPQNIFRKDREGRFTFANQRFCEMAHRSLAELVGKTDLDLFPPELAEKYRRDDERVMETGQILETVEDHRASNGRTLSVQVVKTPLYDVQGRVVGIQGIFWDVTERKQLEVQLRQAQKMEAIGRLAGGVAHDFNNVLTLIQGYTQLLLTEGNLDEDTKGMLKEVFLAGERAAKLSRQLLTFSREKTLCLEILGLNAVVQGLTKMLTHIIGEDVKVHSECSAALPPIQADAGMLEQVIMNLVVNARDAMPNGGDVYITTEAARISGAHVQKHPQARVGDFVRLAVRDTGGGMSTEIMSRIFEPFFTTKEAGKGTGLGLAMVYAIASRHQGWVEVESQVGAGTTFRIYLPVSPVAAADAVAPAAPPASRGGSETVLLVEDEPTVRTFARMLLDRYGYRVLEAVSGKDALRMYGQHSAEISVVVTDMVMPDGMTGRDLAASLRALKRDLKFVFTSGYSAEVTGFDTGFRRREGIQFLQKPYSPQALAQTVRNCLDEK